MTADYDRFLARKRLVVPSVGIDVAADDLPSFLFPFQRDLVRWSLRKGRAALFADTGLGKTAMQLAWAQHAAERVLILAPLAVARQTVAEGARWGVTVTHARKQQDAAAAGITVTNYEMLPHFDPAAFGAVVLDECLAKGTNVLTGDGWKHIENIRIGESIRNASGWDSVSDVHRREVPYAVRLTVRGCRIVSSPNHPYFTQRGWVCAQDLTPGDALMETASAVRMVRGDVHGGLCAGGQDAILRAVLLSEMADASAGAQGEGAYAGDGQEAGREAACLAGLGAPRGAGRTRADPRVEPHEQSSRAGEGLPPIESHEAQTFRAWGQRGWLDEAAGDLAGCTRTDLGSGVSLVVGRTDSRLSHRLQARLSAFRATNQYRSGWSLPLQPEGGRSEAGCEGGFARVDGLEVLEQGHPDLERLRDADGKLYFYDLGGTRHPSFTVDGGLLVHNSSILKSFEGKTRTALIAAFRETPMRLCCTATPAPNDIAELANHAEFLGIMSRTEMLAAFFVHDDEGWRLKGHARDPFYRWLASWGMSLKRPSDLGYSDEGYTLPPLSIRPVIVPTDWTPPGQLFPTALKGVADRGAVRHDTLHERVSRAVALVAAEPSEPWLLWCGLNDEATALTRAIPGAVNVQGADDPDTKADALARFVAGEVRVLVTKPSIAGFGLNLQHCARMAFVGLGDSYEQYYQAIRRCYRFGQQREVHAYVVLTEPEEVIYQNVLRKEREAEATAAELVQHVAQFEQAEIGRVAGAHDPYEPRMPMVLPAWLGRAA